MGVTEVVRAAEFALPLLTGIRRRRYRREVVENHEIFHYLRLIEVQKIPAMPCSSGEVCQRIVEDYLPAFEATLEEPENILGESPYWERFMRARQRVVPTHTGSSSTWRSSSFRASGTISTGISMSFSTISSPSISSS